MGQGAAAVIRLEPVDATRWRDCVAVTHRPEQSRFVASVAYYLCLCAYEGLWSPLAILRDDVVVGFCMWAADDDGSRWIGGFVVDAGHQRTGIGRSALAALIGRLLPDAGPAGLALSYERANQAARDLYVSMGFVETGELEGSEVVARLIPAA